MTRGVMLAARAIVVLALALAPAARAQDLPVYTDGLASGFENKSYGGGGDLANATPFHAGAPSIALTGNGHNAVAFGHTGAELDTAHYRALHFWVHGGSAGGQQLRVVLARPGPSADEVVAQAQLDTYIAGGIAAGQWREVTVPFGAGPLWYQGSFSRIDIQADAAGAQPVLYIDDVSLLAGPADLLYGDSFEGSPQAPRGELRFSTATYAVPESVGQVAVHVQRVNGSGGAISVQVASADGSAVAPGDYTAVAATLNWADGDTADKIVNLPVIDDASIEGSETARLVLHDPGGGASLGAVTQATVTISDDDVVCELQVDHDVSVAGMVSDRFNWCDGTHRPRVAVLAHNDGQTGLNGGRGGALREYRYETPGGTRVVPVTSDGNGSYGGFGYIVSHLDVDGQGHVIPCTTGVDNDSPLGFRFPGNFQRVFEGRHHALFAFT